MDPNASIQELICRLEYSTDSERDRALELLTALTGWLARGGFAPNWRMAHNACELAIVNNEARADSEVPQ